MIKSGFKQCVMDTCIYIGTGQSRIILGIHVDDQAFIGPNMQVIKRFKQDSAKEFKMKDLGALTHILGVEVKRDRQNKVLTLHQTSYVRQVLERYDMQDCNATKFHFPPILPSARMMSQAYLQTLKPSLITGLK